MRLDAMKGVERSRREKDQRQREQDYRVMSTYGDSPSYRKYQEEQLIKRLDDNKRRAWDDLLKRAPFLPESKVVQMMTADDFQELPEQLKKALADRLLELEIKPTDHHLV